MHGIVDGLLTNSDLVALPEFQLGGLIVSPARRTIDGPNGRRATEPRVMQLLVALVEARGRVVTRAAIIKRCWGGVYVADESLNRAISELRRVLRAAGHEQAIETIPRTGYRLMLPYELPPGGTAAQLGISNKVADATAAGQRPLRAEFLDPERQGVVTVRGLRGRPDLSNVCLAISEQDMCAIAVLPFVNLTGDPGNDDLADGIAEELITTLSRCNGIKVSARTSTFAYKGRGTDIRTIARDLGVGKVLKGSLRKSGDRLRVTAQLVDAATGFHLWAQSYDRTDADLLVLQDAIAAEIANILEVKLCVSAAQSIDPEALRLHSQAMVMASRASAPALILAIDLYEQALAIEPLFARGHVGLAGTIMIAAMSGVLPLSRMADARNSVKEALRLDPTTASAHGIKAAIDASEGRWIDAETGFMVALEHFRDDPTAISAFAYQLLAPCGHLRRSIEMSCAAVELAPASTAKRIVCAHLALACGDTALARQHLYMATALGVGRDHVGTMILQAEMARLEGRLPDADAIMEKVMRPIASPALTDALPLVHRALAKQAAPQKATAAVNRLVASLDNAQLRWGDGYLATILMCWQARLGALDEAYALADRISSLWRQSYCLSPPFLRQMWRFDMQAFRDDPRFQGAVERFGMIDYWLRFGAPDGYQLFGRQLVRTT